MPHSPVRSPYKPLVNIDIMFPHFKRIINPMNGHYYQITNSNQILRMEVNFIRTTFIIKHYIMKFAMLSNQLA